MKMSNKDELNACVSPSSGVWISLLLLGVSAPAMLGYLGDRCKSVTSEIAAQRKKHYAVQRKDLQTVQMSKQEAMLEVKGMYVFRMVMFRKVFK